MDVHIGHQHRHIPDHGAVVAAVHGDPLGDDLTLGEHGEQGPHIIDDLGLGQVRGDHGQNIIQHGQHVPGALALVGGDQRVENIALPVGTAEVAGTAGGAVPGMPQSLGTGEDLFARGNIIAAHLSIDVLGLRLAQIDLHTAQQIDDMLELVEIHFHIGIHDDAEVLIQGLVQQLHAAQIIGDIDAVIIVAVGQVQIEVAHEGGHGNGLLFLVEGHQDHGIGTGPVLAGAAVLADEHDIDDIVLTADGLIDLAPVDLVLVHCGCRGVGVDGLVPGVLDGLDLCLGEGRHGGVPVHIVRHAHHILNKHGDAQPNCQHDSQHHAQDRQDQAFAVSGLFIVHVLVLHNR